MASVARRFGAIVVASLVVGAITTVFAQTQTKSTETRQFEVVSVQGDKLVAKTADGTKEYTIPSDFRFTVDGKQVPLSELKPGQKGTATITTITTVHPVTVTEVKNGEVMQASGSSVIVKTPTGIKMFSPGDLEKRNITIMKDGKAVDLSGLHAGDRLSATIITEKPPHVMTQREVQATLGSVPAASATSGSAASTGAKSGSGTGGAKASAAPAAGAGAAGAGTGATAKPAASKTLPKTASQFPLVGLVAMLLLATGTMLTVARRRRA